MVARSADPMSVAIVTGGSCGIGREVARTVASLGYAVVVVYLDDRREAEATVEGILAADGTALSIRADLNDELDVERLFTETAAAFGRVDVVVQTTVRGTSLVMEQAARRLGPAGAVVVVASGLAEIAALRDRWRPPGT